MALNKNKLKTNLVKLYTTKTQEEAFHQWNSSLTDYFKDAISGAFTPSRFSVDLSISFKKSTSLKTFIQDFDKNLSDWISGVTWTNGKDMAKSVAPSALGFQDFSKAHELDTDFNKYQDLLTSLLHDWFSKITV